MIKQRGSSAKPSQSRADSRKVSFILEITNPEAASAETVQTPESRVSAAPAVGSGKVSVDLTEKREHASQATAGAPSASGLFVTEPGPASFRREANRFGGLLKPFLQHAFIKYFTEQKAHFKSGKPL